MGIVEEAIAKAKARKARVVLPETAEDARIAEAANRLVAEGLAEPVPLAEPSDALAEVLVANRGVKPAIAARMVGKPLIRAAGPGKV